MKKNNRFIALVTPNGRICRVCQEEKPLTQFRNASHVKIDGKMAQCKSCMASKEKEYIKNLPEGVHNERRKKYAGDYALNINYKRFYGLNLDIVKKMLESQNGRCANLNCLQEITLGGKSRASKACLDHNHETGKIRGLICNPCNMYVGVMENKKKFLGLRDYLKKYDVVPDYIKEC